MSEFNSTPNNLGGPRVNPMDYPSVICPECGCKYWMPVMQFRQVPGIIMGTGDKPQLVPIQAYVCAKCKTLIPDLAELDKEPESSKEANQTNTKTSLIL